MEGTVEGVGMVGMVSSYQIMYSVYILVLCRTRTSHKPKYHLLMESSSMERTKSMMELIQNNISEQTEVHLNSSSLSLLHIKQMMILIDSLSTSLNKSRF